MPPKAIFAVAVLLFVHGPSDGAELNDALARLKERGVLSAEALTKVESHLHTSGGPAGAATAADAAPSALSTADTEWATRALERLRNMSVLSAEHAAAAAAALRSRDTAVAAAGGAGASLAQKYGFYMHVYADPAAVIYMVDQIHKFFPGSPIHIMSDGGMGFDGLCKQKGCTFQHCPPANDRWHPWAFFRRFVNAATQLNTEFVVMLEPDNTIHRPIIHHPTTDAGGMFDHNPRFGGKLVEHVEAQAQKHRPGFKWEYKGSGLAGGSVFRTAAVLDAFSDEALAEIDWAFIESGDSKRVYSSDFAMPIALSIRGYSYGPWKEIKQVESHDVPDQPDEAAFQHYGRGYKGGKPTYNLRPTPEQKSLYSVHPEFTSHEPRCQKCWNLDKFNARWGDKAKGCASAIPYKYNPWKPDAYGRLLGD